MPIMTSSVALMLMQLESQRELEAEKAARKHDEVREAHSRLKRLDKDLKQLMSNQVVLLACQVRYTEHSPAV